MCATWKFELKKHYICYKRRQVLNIKNIKAFKYAITADELALLLILTGHRNKFHATATHFFLCNRTKLCFRVRMAKLMLQKLLKQNQLRFLNRYFSRWRP